MLCDLNEVAGIRSIYRGPLPQCSVFRDLTTRGELEVERILCRGKQFSDVTLSSSGTRCVVIENDDSKARCRVGAGVRGGDLHGNAAESRCGSFVVSITFY